MWVVVGLGNPGREYASTRHNVGFLFLKRIAKRWRVGWRKTGALMRKAEFEKDKEKIVLVLPQTYMNRSGIAARKIIETTGISPERVLVIYDDLDIPLGEIRVRKEGGAGTHKGIKSIIEEIQTTRFPRIRVGIGPLPEGEEATGFVLSPFEEEEKALLERSFDNASEALSLILAGKIEMAMNLFNQRRKME